jgi:neuropeptide Y receptor
MTSNMFTLNFDEATTKLHVTSMNHSSPNVTTSTLTTTAATFDQTPSTSATIGEPVTASADLTSDGIWHVAVIVAFLSVIVMSIVGNGLVVLTIFTCRRMRSVTNYFIVSLSGADLLMAVGIPFALVANWFERRWPFGAVLCPVITYLQSVAVFLSAFTMVGLSIDRFRAVVFPLRPRITGRQAAVAIGNIWLLAASVPLPVAIVSQVDPDSGFCVEQWPYSTWQHAFTMTLLVLQYFLPLGVLAVTYATICYVIWVKRSPGEVLQNGRDRRIALAKRKVSRTNEAENKISPARRTLTGKILRQ